MTQGEGENQEDDKETKKGHLSRVKGRITKLSRYTDSTLAFIKNINSIYAFIGIMLVSILSFVAWLFPPKNKFDHLQARVFENCLSKTHQKDQCACVSELIPKRVDQKLYDAILFAMESPSDKEQAMGKLRGKYNMSQTDVYNYYRLIGGSNMEFINRAVGEASPQCGLAGYKP